MHPNDTRCIVAPVCRGHIAPNTPAQPAAPAPTDEQRVDAIRNAITDLNALLGGAAAAGLKVEICTNTIDRIGAPSSMTVSLAGASRQIYPKGY